MTPEKKVLWIDPEAYGQLKLIMDLPTMIVGLGEVVEKPDGYHLVKILVPEQESSGFCSDASGDAWGKDLHEYITEGGNVENLRLYFRNSPKSRLFCSATDEETMAKLFQFSDYSLVLIGNEKAMSARADILRPERQRIDLTVKAVPGAMEMSREEKIDFIGKLVAKVNGLGLEQIAKFLEKLARE